MTDPIYFVYIKTNGLVFPQKWNDDQTNTHNGKCKWGEVNEDGPLVFKKKLEKEEEHLSLDELKAKYPYSPKE